MKIVIPSAGRSKTIRTHKLLSEYLVCVPEAEAPAYADAVGENNLLTHPDAVKGLTPKLNWILDRFEREDAIVLLDDDLVSLRRNFTAPGEASVVDDPAVAHEVIEQTVQLARDCGAYLFGWDPNNEAIRYHGGLDPILLTGYINGCACGFRRGHRLRYDERIVAKNDFDICAQNAFKHRIALRNTRYTWVQKGTFVSLGGQASHRNSETEKRDVELLLRKYGRIFKKGGLSGVRKVDYAGVEKITMHLPF